MTRIGLALVLLFLIADIPMRATPDRKDPAPPAWLDQPQTYGMVPLLPETAARLHVSCNGIWGGAGGAHPIVGPRQTVHEVSERYGQDAARFVRACHSAGMRVCGIVNGIEGFDALRAALPNLDDMACRDARGRAARVGNEMLLMCSNNPSWMEWRIAQGKRAIDLGADIIQLDTPMGPAFISGFLRAGFCRHCISRFHAFLQHRFSPLQLEARFGLSTWDPQAVIARLSPLQDLSDPARRPYHNGSKDDLLFRQFIACQEQASFAATRRVTQALRAHAAARKRSVALTTNASDLGTVNPAGHWIRAIMFADLVDLFAYELNAEPAGMPSDALLAYPHGRWSPYHRLAYAIKRRRSPAVIHAGHMGRLLTQVLSTGKSFNAWMEVQSAEAYAANGAYVQYHVQPPGPGHILLEKCWVGTARHAAFVRAHSDLYGGQLTSGSPMAVLFLMNERGRTIPGVCPSYLGFAQALDEGTYPFDVLFGGDGRYVRDRLRSADLRPYRVLLVPSPIEPTDGQRRVLQRFLADGGTLVCQEPARMGLKVPAFAGAAPPGLGLGSSFRHGRGRVLVLGGALTRDWTDDAGANYARSRAPALREQIGRLARHLGVDPLITGGTSVRAGLVSAYPVVQARRRRIVVHLVNCDLDDARDAVRTQTGLVLRLPRAAFLRGRVTAQLLKPGVPAQPLAVSVGAGRPQVALPPLGAWAAVVVTAAGAR